MAVEVRDMREGDCGPLAGIIREVWSMDLYGDGLGQPGSLGYLLSCIEGSTLRLTALSDGEVVGCVIARSLGTPDAPDVSG